MKFHMFRNGTWAPAQAAKGKLFDKPILVSSQIEPRQVGARPDTLKVQTRSTR